MPYPTAKLLWDIVARLCAVGATLGVTLFGIGLYTGNTAAWVVGGMALLVFGGAAPIAIAESYAVDHADWKWTFTYQTRRLLASHVWWERALGLVIMAFIGGMAIAMTLLFGHYALGWWVNG